MTAPGSRDRLVLGTLLPGFDGTELPGWLAARLAGGLAGVCLFATNIASPSQLRRLTGEIRAANPFAIIAIDEEGGDVTRLYQSVGSPFPGNAILGRLDDLLLTESVARRVGAELRAAGIDLDLAPTIDINSNDDNPVIGTRSFGADPQLVARHGAAWVEGLQSTGIAASAKHFPGHGDTATDSHLALPTVDLPLDALRRRELVPFAAAIAAGTRTIMTSHILLPQLDAQPATFSERILGELLRGQLGFTGVIVTDALDMRGADDEDGLPGAAARALAAGADLLCLGTANTEEQLAAIVAGVSAAVDDGRLSVARPADAARRVAELAGELRSQAVRPFAVPDPLPEFDTAVIARAFDLASGLRLRADRALVQLRTESNIAVGDSPWGPAAAGAPVQWLAEGEPLIVDSDRQPVLIGRDNHRRAWTRRAIDEARSRHPDVVVVDMGWPAADRRYADIATFGASRLAGAALLRLLEERGR
ncbi:beta-N-acetylhexosaminidase [Lysinimonas soli]|uniref:Beta-N-acetylhexosaminidase n=1 Tax=Lysinimonas soli TaxID=1074233 RepID=A0ABW0NSJ2_9MICO